MSSAVRWLTAHEQHLWRGWLKLNAELASTLQRELQQDVGLSMPDFEVLVHLTDNPEGRVRVTELAGLLQWERSRVSHHIKRMERRGLVERVECSVDGRGAFVVITPEGRAAIEEAAPGHVMAVRRLMFDVLSEEEKAALSAVIDKLLARADHAPTQQRLQSTRGPQHRPHALGAARRPSSPVAGPRMTNDLG